MNTYSEPAHEAARERFRMMVDANPIVTHLWKDQLKELKREMALREKFYVRWIGEGKMTQATADNRMAATASTIALVESLIEAKRKRDEPSLFGD